MGDKRKPSITDDGDPLEDNDPAEDEDDDIEDGDDEGDDGDPEEGQGKGGSGGGKGTGKKKPETNEERLQRELDQAKAERRAAVKKANAAELKLTKLGVTDDDEPENIQARLAKSERELQQYQARMRLVQVKDVVRDILSTRKYQDYLSNARYIVPQVELDLDDIVDGEYDPETLQDQARKAVAEYVRDNPRTPASDADDARGERGGAILADARERHDSTLKLANERYLADIKQAGERYARAEQTAQSAKMKRLKKADTVICQANIAFEKRIKQLHEDASRLYASNYYDLLKKYPEFNQLVL